VGSSGFVNLLNTVQSLGGNSDYVPGGNYTATFTVTGGSRVVSLPDFARGPGQDVTIPASSSGLPIKLDNASGVSSLELNVQVNPNLLSITDAALGFPGSTWTITKNFSQAANGLVRLSLIGSQPLSGTNATLINLTARVPDGALYGDTEVIRPTSVRVNPGARARRERFCRRFVHAGDGAEL
jgi:hypothetical protein